MANFESKLDPTQLMRVHRIYIINLTLITKLHKEARNTVVKLINCIYVAQQLQYNS
ncbi:MAG: DNA-binding LytR/AlgR family response regulator [Phenylobacterium sp.]|jgi:DNA-binding LytR/AlgR family response regulator